MNYNTPEEISSFQQFLRGDERGFTDIYRRRYKTTLNYARNMLQDEFEINSITQDAFLLAWKHRERMKSILHFQRFVHLYVRWRCYGYYKRKKINPEMNTLSLDSQTHIASYDPQKEKEQNEHLQIEAESLQLIDRAIPYLPRNKQIIIKLFNRGFSPKKIARRIGMSYQRTTRETKRTLDTLKRIVKRLKNAADAFKGRPLLLASDFEIYLTVQQAHILRLFHEERLSFSKISQELNITPFQLAKQYLLIMKKTNGLNKKKFN